MLSTPPNTSSRSDAPLTADLTYVSQTQPGITRVRSRSGFRYLDPTGQPIRSDEVLARILALAIPPAWSDVWICALASGHLQAVGRDARGRRQYRYHPLWRSHREATKFGELLLIAQALPALRSRVQDDLARPALSREKVLAVVVRLLETTLIRIGNEDYARENDSFGLTTLEDSHAQVDGTQLRFEFRGKSGKHHVVGVHNPRLVRIVKQCQDIPGQELFQYLDEDGIHRHVESGDVNEYLHELGGQEFTAKDFRTWGATVLAIEVLRKAGSFRSPKVARRTVVMCLETVARRLGNTSAVCRKAYVHPGAIEAYLAGTLEGLCGRDTFKLSSKLRGCLTAGEVATVVFLQAHGLSMG
jgi:DNA topoisomerase-1